MGALFFYDRTILGNWPSGLEWMRSMMPFVSSFPSTRLFRGLSSHEMESGVVLVNKSKRFLGMLAACKLNSKRGRELWSYRVFHGDKETFWLGFEMIQEPYAFLRSYGSVIGELGPDDDLGVCGVQVHLDHQGRLFW